MSCILGPACLGSPPQTEQPHIGPRLSEATARDAEIKSRIPRPGSHLAGAGAVTLPVPSPPTDTGHKVSSSSHQALPKASATLQVCQQFGQTPPPAAARQKAAAKAPASNEPVPAATEEGEEGGGTKGGKEGEGATEEGKCEGQGTAEEEGEGAAKEGQTQHGRGQP